MHGDRLTAAPDEGPRAVDDATLVEAVARGDRDALVRLYDRHASVLLALGVRMLGDRARAEELVHDLFVAGLHPRGDLHATARTPRPRLGGPARSPARAR